MNQMRRSDETARTATAASGDDPQWYKDAVIYQLHVKAFLDAGGDGIGDLQGLIQQLDYIKGLGATAIWLLPFYPSPLRDDGYDISDYRKVNPAYGTMGDFRRLIREAHRRGLRVITELVINHTSDQHPWFQRARKAKPGSNARDFYVWSDNDQAYSGTRIIFLDTEKSNWTWDAEARAYYWHRFYSHQPDLNFDNPKVFEEITKVLHFWLDQGVDGLRLDAVPYLIEREGTNNENLPETHEVLKRLRHEMDTHYPDRMLLAEANQWPEDACPYFGDGDECHMAFHFPLMPRIYMALAQEDRHPISDIIRQTPEIPDNCQWAIFLRNHDELTLEMVTDSERDYLWQTYANDRRARINLGIRRRLAPLLENDRRKIELLNGMLMSMPGTPVIYYGDEIGMGDNIYLGDRDGVRTPMQWSADRNGGFSRAAPQKLFLPPIMDPIHGYEAVNVEAQQESPASLLNWMRRLISVRKSRTAFGRGKLRLLYPRNRKVLAYLREHGDEIILCVANLSRSAQAVELDMQGFSGHVPVELLSRSPFPPIGELPYLLTLAPYGFYWFSLAKEADLPEWHLEHQAQLPEFVTIVLSDGWNSVSSGAGGRILEQEVLPAYLQMRRWFAGHGRGRLRATLKDRAVLEGPGTGYLLTEVEVAQQDKVPQRYFMPLALRWGEDILNQGSPLLALTLARVRRGARMGLLREAVASEDFARTVIAAMRDGTEAGTGSARVRFHSTSGAPEIEGLAETEVRVLGGEQSNTTVILGDQLVLKFYRRLQPGLQPELEIAAFLTETAHFEHTPALFGWVDTGEGEDSVALAVAFDHVANQGDAWRFTVEELDRILDEAVLTRPSDNEETDLLALSVERARLLGRRTAELHAALATPTDNPAFSAEKVTADDVAHWADLARQRVAEAIEALEREATSLPEGAAADARRLLAARKAIDKRIGTLARSRPTGMKTRTHGDYHLGQVLVAQEDFSIIDFEGEPQRPLEERRAKSSPLRDIAGMLRSYEYAALTALEQFWADGDRDDIAEALLLDWHARATDAFIGGYASVSGDDWSGPGNRPPLLELFLIEKAFYEISYEASHRPKWLHVPVRGAVRLLDLDRKSDS
ncbi:MAG: maltose alpha-D-glucosyltransferase [Acetobacterales bacterium]